MVADVTNHTAASRGSFVDFFRQYTKTWIHAVAAAGLTAFGTLTVVHHWFAALALASYVVPPVVLYVWQGGPVSDETKIDADSSAEPVGERNRAGSAGRDSSTIGPVDSADVTEWTTAESAVDTALFDVTLTPAAAYAVGGEGVVLADREDGWTAVLEDGPGAKSRTLRGVDATADESAIWITGDGGALARIDAATGRHTDFSAPKGITDNWANVAIGGDGGDENILLVNGSGEAVRGQYRDGDVAWAGPTKPGDGSSLNGVDFVGRSVGYLCDTNNGVFETTDGGESFRKVGVEAVDGTLTDVAAVELGYCTVSADDGVLHRYDGTRWTPHRIDDEAIWAIADRGRYAVACGEGGTVYERSDADNDWSRSTTPATGPLWGIATGDGRSIGVGADGAIVERRW